MYADLPVLFQSFWKLLLGKGGPPLSMMLVGSAVHLKIAYTSRFVRIILARGPCKSSLYRSNFTDGSRREFGFVPTLTFSLANIRVIRNRSCQREISQDAGAPNFSPERAANLQHSPGRI